MIVVAGEALVDLLVDHRGNVDGRLGGGPFNVARGLARLEAPCAFLGAVSNDRFGVSLAGALQSDGVDGRCLVRTDLPTTLAVASITEGSATYTFYLEGTSAPALTGEDVARVLPERPTALHVGTLGLAVDPMATAIEELVAGASDETLVMVDPNYRRDVGIDEEAYQARLGRVLDRAHVIKVSTDDLELMAAGKPALDTARGLLSERTRCVLVTAGADAVHVLTAAGEREIGTVPVRVVDTVGAGDAFCAGFLSRWLRDGRGIDGLGDLEAVATAASFAALVAGVSCQRVGADPPRLSELKDAPVHSW